MFRSSFRFVSTAWILLVASSLSSVSSAQCLRWENDFRQPATDGAITCLLAHDEGSGPALYAGGSFLVAGGVTVRGIGRWDGKAWSSLAGGVNSTFGGNLNLVNALALFDDGTGPALYAGGRFIQIGGVTTNGIARWDGSAWHALGTINLNSGVDKLVVFDDGSGAALYAAGFFIDSGLPPGTNGIVRWDGHQWSAVGTGPSVGNVKDLIVHDDGSGPALYSARTLVTTGTTSNSISRWNGTAWIAIATQLGPYDQLRSLCSFDDGSGPALYAAGPFGQIEGVPTPSGVARWDGTSWTDSGNGVVPNFGPYQLSVLDDGSGAKLFLITGSSAPQVRVWNGSTWTATLPGLLPNVLGVYDDGSGKSIYAGGAFAPTSTLGAAGIARWNGGAWVQPGDPNASRGVNNILNSLATFDDGSGSKLYATGGFSLAGSTYTPNGVARFDGSTWTSLPRPGTIYPALLQVLDLGAGPNLVAAEDGVFTWTGSGWSLLPASDLPTPATAIATCNFGSGPSLFAGGTWGNVGGVQLNGIGRYAGAGWEALGSGMNGGVDALEAFDDGSGMKLFAGGTFTTAGGSPAQRIAAWNGTSWSSIGNLDNHVLALRAFDDGSGPKLFVGGAFSSAGGVPAQGVARWNGSSFSPTGSGLGGIVRAFTAFDDGSGPALYACGDFIDSAGASIPRIAKWTGSTWISLGSGINGRVSTMAVFDGGHGPSLFAGGTFGTAGADSSVNIAEWRACTSPIESMCFGDGTVRPCPCGNEGLPEHGCQNSASTGGARLNASGAVNPDTLVLHSHGELPNALSIFLQGNQLVSAGTRFGDGVRCVGGSLVRLYAKSASGGAANAPQAGDLSISARSAQLGDVIAPGSVRYYQTYYRDPNLTFCPPPQGDAWNVTNGLRVVW